LLRYEDEIRSFFEMGTDSQIETGVLPESGSPDDPEETALGFLDVVQGAREAFALQGAATREEAQALMNEFARGASDAGLSRGQVRDLLDGLIPEEASWAPDAQDMVDEAVGFLAIAEGEPQGDQAPVEEEGTDPEGPSEALGPAARDSIDSLNRAIQLALEDLEDAQAAHERTQRALEEEQARGGFSWFWDLIDDLGIGSLWAALYLTIVHAWWRGTSVGKKLFRIRVVMIDKRPLNWWLSFERTGGYAAGFATGLLGFAQIFWDPNRQAIHDKVSETIVIQDGRDPVPGPWIEEGRSQWTHGRHGPLETPEV